MAYAQQGAGVMQGVMQGVQGWTCHQGIPCSSSSGQAGGLQHAAAQLADLEHQAGPHLRLGEDL